MSVISVPTTLSITSLRGADEFFQPLTKAIETIKTESNNSFSGFDQQLQNQYVNFGNQVIDNTKQGLSQLGAKANEIRESGEESVVTVNQQKEDINYYAFQLGVLIKAAIRSIPTIIKDTVIMAATGGEGQHLLSAHKIYSIVTNEKFKEFVTALSSVVTKYEDIMSKTTNEDTRGIIQIFKELQMTNIKQFLEKVQTNSQSLEEDKSKYCNAAKLMMHVLIGKNEIEKIKTTIGELTAQLEALKDSLSSIVNSSGINVDSIKSQLNTLSSSPQIQDPCSKQQ